MSRPPAWSLFSAGFLCLVAASPLHAQDDFQNAQMPDIKGRLAGISQTPQSSAPAASEDAARRAVESAPDRPSGSESRPFSPEDCNFSPFAPQPGQPACESIPYTPAACREFAPAWSEGQVKAKFGKICLGFKDVPEKTCDEEPNNIKCFLERHPQACNYLSMSAWTPCLNELFLECIEHGDLSGGEPIWVTPPEKIPAPHSKFWTASEVCHWYKHKNRWPTIESTKSR